MKDLGGRSYDLLWLVDRHEPVGSIRLVELMRQRGYSITDRTIRLTLSELDETGLTEKVAGRGRRLTDEGRSALARGNVTSRLERVRSRIVTLTSRVTYDPIEDTGRLIASTAYVDADAIEPAVETLLALDELPLGGFPVSVSETAAEEPADYRLAMPSSITLDGVLLSRGLDTDLRTAGILEYTTGGDCGGTIERYVDVLNGEGATIDAVTVLIEAGRTDMRPLLSGEKRGLTVADYRKFPLTRYEEARDLTAETRRRLGGGVDVRRPREEGPFPTEPPGLDFGSATYAGIGEVAIAALVERELTDEWDTLYGTMARNEVGPAGTLDPNAPTME